jgi:protein-tyrosine phosphatase
MKILMVCLGNICRSPLAEGILRSKTEKLGLDWSIDSAGTGAWHVGQKPDLRSINVAKKYGIDISKLKARQLVADDIENFDLIYVMDKQNLKDVSSLAKSKQSKVKLILEEMFKPFDAVSMNEVPDPYYGTNDVFEHVYSLLDRACDEIMDKFALQQTG